MIVYHRLKPRPFAVNCTPRCSVMPDGVITFPLFPTANQSRGNWPSNARILHAPFPSRCAFYPNTVYREARWKCNVTYTHRGSSITSDAFSSEFKAPAPGGEKKRKRERSIIKYRNITGYTNGILLNLGEKNPGLMSLRSQRPNGDTLRRSYKEYSHFTSYRILLSGCITVQFQRRLYE